MIPSRPQLVPAPDEEGLDRLHPLSPVALAASQVQVLGGAAVGGFAGGWWVTVAVVGVTIVALTIGHRFRRWGFDGERVIYRSGMFQRSVRTLTVDRVQQVDLHQNIVHRMLGLVDVRVESASGASGADIALQALGEDQGRTLRDEILAARARAATGVRPTNADSLMAPDVGGDGDPDVVLATMSAGHAAAGGVSDARDLLLGSSAAAFLGPLVEDVAGSGGAALAIGALVALVAVPAVAAITGAVRYGDYTLTRTTGEVRARYGLLNTRDEATPLHRVQAIALRENLLRRLFDAAEIRIRSAGSAGQESATRLTAPFLPRDTAIGVLTALWPDAIDIGPMQPAPVAALRRARFRWTAWPAALAAAATLVAVAADAPALVAAWLLVPLGWWFGGAVHRALGHTHGNGYLVVRQGPIGRVTSVVPAAKAQTVRVRTTPFQRRWGLADLYVDVAGTGAVRARELPYERAVELAGVLSETARHPGASRASSER